MTNNFVVYNPVNMHILKGSNGNEAKRVSSRSAKRILNTAIKKGRVQEGEYVIDTVEAYEAEDGMVEVKSLMTGAPVMIRKSERGGCCDPSTERYWSM